MRIVIGEKDDLHNVDPPPMLLDSGSTISPLAMEESTKRKIQKGTAPMVEVASEDEWIIKESRDTQAIFWTEVVLCFFTSFK